MMNSDDDLESQAELEDQDERDETPRENAFDDEREKYLREWVDRLAAITKFDRFAGTSDDGLDDDDPTVRAYREWIATHEHEKVALPAPGGGTEICEIYIRLKPGCTFSTTDKVFERFARYSDTVSRRLKQFDQQYRGWTLDEIEDDDTPLYLLANTIPSQEITVAYGKRKAMKSALYHKLAIVVATPGMDFDGEPVTHGPVLYITLDPGANRKRVKARILEICERMGVKPPRDLVLVDTPLALDKPESVASLLRNNPGPFALVVIDSLYKAVTPGGDLSQAGIMTPATDGLQEIADSTGAAVVVLHHEGRGGLGHPYGSVFLEAALSSLVHIVHNETTNRVTATVELMKNGPARELPFQYRADGLYLGSLTPRAPRPTSDAPSIVPDVLRPDMLALIPTTPTLIREARRLIEHLLEGAPDAREKQWHRIRKAWEDAGLIVQKGGMIRRVVQ